jgi:tRNA modification GTPase
LAKSILGRLPPARTAVFSAFLDATGEALDEGIALFYPAPHSYTGEDVLELQGHGGLAAPQLVLQRCLELGARVAAPGEFTERAFLNNKLDLAQAESVVDLIDATTAQAARSAFRSLQGDFSVQIRKLVDQLIRLRMLTEAMLDFPEEGIDALDFEQRNKWLAELMSELDKILGLAKQGSILREGAHVALVGQPNVGKSSLLNRLSGEEVAIVSDVPGTTRDVIRQAIQLNGVPLHIMDTAGLRISDDVVERIGIARTYGAIQKADAILLIRGADGEAEDADNERILSEMPSGVPVLRIFNKIDLVGKPAGMIEEGHGTSIYLSAKTGEGIDLLREKLLALVGWHHESGVFMARERHVRALVEAQGNLQTAYGVASQPELFAEELRLAQEALNSITGEFTSDDLLGEIFSRFCIGK